MTYKSGFVSIVGRPNVGKSTLVNYFAGQKVAITSVRPQTTRNRIKTIYSTDEGQIIFIDTPGVHRPKNKLDKFMLREVYESLDGIDVVLFMVEATFPPGKGDRYIKKQLQNIEIPVLGIMNKIDEVNNKQLVQRQKKYSQHMGLDVIPISARTGRNIDTLVEKILELLPEGPQYYPEDMVTDRLEQFVISEFVREKVFQLTRQEIPYGVAVVIEEYKERENGKLFIRANIYVEKKSHKGIIIGKNGRLIKEVGRRARRDVEKLLNQEIYLDLWVKVQKDWREDENLLKRMGYKA
ncbi:MAG: GTPase Era [Halanaerobiaceae bacterium]